MNDDLFEISEDPARVDRDAVHRVLLATLDAHGLYDRHGFQELRYPERFLERLDRRHYDGEE